MRVCERVCETQIVCGTVVGEIVSETDCVCVVSVCLCGTVVGLGFVGVDLSLHQNDAGNVSVTVCGCVHCVRERVRVCV